MTAEGQASQYLNVIFHAAPEVRGELPFRRFSARIGAAALLFSVAALPARGADLIPWTEAPPPAFSLPTLGGGDTALTSHPGETVLVHFFATWCEPCRDELPALTRLASRGAPSLKIIAISVAEVDARVQRFLAPMAVGFPVLLDRDRAVAKAWRVSSLPTTFVLNDRLEAKLVVEADYAWDAIEPRQLVARASAGDAQQQQQANHANQGGSRQ